MADPNNTEVTIKEEEMPNAGNGKEVANPLSDPHLIEVLKSKLSSTFSAPPPLPKKVKRKVKALKKIQLEHTNLEAAFYRELHELECKYENSYAPLYEKRRVIVCGLVEPTDEECEYPSDSEKDLIEEMQKVSVTDNAQNEKTEEEEKDIKGIPLFWLTAFKSASLIADLIEEHDEPILKHLIDVKARVDKDPMGFLLEFYFEPNEFFSNTVLTKYYEMKCMADAEEPFSFDGPEIVKSKGCTIEWKKGMNVTMKTIKKKQKHRARGAVRVVTKTVQNDSFFHFFSPPTVPEDDEDVDEDIRNSLTADFEVGNYIKDRIIPQAVLYFTGENLADEYDEEEDEEEEEEFDEEDDDSENENDTGNLGRKKPTPSGDSSQQQDPPPECKQQ